MHIEVAWYWIYSTSKLANFFLLLFQIKWLNLLYWFKKCFPLKQPTSHSNFNKRSLGLQISFLPDAKQEKCTDLILWSQIYEVSSVKSEALVFILFKWKCTKVRPLHCELQVLHFSNQYNSSKGESFSGSTSPCKTRLWNILANRYKLLIDIN